jgi:hypothetical protein
MPEPHLRAGDDDREVVAAALGQHMASGRLTLAEYEDRLAQAYASRTFGDLAALTADLPPLPTTPPPPEPAPDPAPTGSVPSSTPLVVPAPVVAPWSSWHGHAEHSWRAWLSTSVIVLVVYLAISLGNGEFDYFWPIWVIGPWGAVLLVSRLGGSGARPRNENPRVGR